MFLKAQHAHLTGPCVTQDSSHINWGVGHDGVIVEFLLGFVSVFQLLEEISHGFIITTP